jgi:hypothetical protein
MVFSTTFNNISVISWWSFLLMEETGVPGENHRPVASNWQTLSHNVLHRSCPMCNISSIGATFEGCDLLDTKPNFTFNMYSTTNSQDNNWKYSNVKQPHSTHFFSCIVFILRFFTLETMVYNKHVLYTLTNQTF